MKKNLLTLLVLLLLLSGRITNAQYLYTAAGNGINGFGGDGAAATLAQLKNPFGIAFDPYGNLYIADEINHRIRRVDKSTGIITTVAGSSTYGTFYGDGGPATSASFYNPHAVAVDSAGNLYIVDTNNNRIRKVDNSTGIINTIAGSAGQGYTGDGGPATLAQLRNPTGIALDRYGNVYIAEQINNCIRKVTVSTGIITTVAGTGTGGYNGDGIRADSAELAGPWGVAVDTAGNIYIADRNNNRVRKVTVATGLISTIAGNGGAGFGGDGGPATSANLNSLLTVAVDASGNVYIADDGNNRVRKITTATGIISTVAGNGSKGFSANGTLATSAALSGVYGVAVDGSCSLFFTDSYNNLIRAVPVTDSAFVTITSSSLSLCSSGNVTFNAIAAGGGATPSFQWTVNGVNQGTNSPAFSSASLGNGATVSCTMTSSVSCVVGSPATSNTITIVTGNNVHAGNVTASRDTICIGTPVNLTLTGYSGNIHWQSSPGNTSFQTISGASLPVYSSILPYTAYYRAYADSGACSDTSAAVRVVVVPSPQGQFSYSNTGLQVTFNSGTSSSDVSSYYWDFGDSTVSHDVNPLHTYSKPDIFIVCLTVYNNSNCSYTICKNVDLSALGISSVAGMVNGLQLYPVPATKSINVSTHGLAGNYQLLIYNVLGQNVEQRAVTITPRQTLSVDLKNFTPGSYELVLLNDDEYYNARFIHALK